MRATILVLEDDPVLQELLCEVLQDEGHDVTSGINARRNERLYSACP